MKILRWILVLPSSILALVIVFSIYSFGYKLVGENPTSFFNRALLGVFCSIAYIKAGIYIAPSHKGITAIVLSVIGICGAIFELTKGFDIGNLISIMVMVSLAYSEYENDKKENLDLT